jgi:heat shock protein HslJ
MLAATAFLALAGCGPKPADEPADAGPPPGKASASDPAPGTITDREWHLVAMGELPAPMGAGSRPITLRLESSGTRAVGFAGCNRYSGPFTLAGDSLRFGPAISTKMSCGDADQVEQGFLAMLPLVVGYEATATSLVLNGPGGPLARFRQP